MVTCVAMIADGAYGTLLAPRVRSGEHVDDLCLRAPHLVVEAHRAYLDAGARRLQTNSFMAWATPTRRRRDIYRAALACAREAAAVAAMPGTLVTATIGPAGREPRAFYADLELLLDEGVGHVTCETVTDTDTATAFLRAFEEVVAGAPARAVLSLSVTPDAGLDAWRWIARLRLPDGVEPGLNCCAGPDGMRDPLDLLCEHGLPVHVSPSAGLPERDAVTGTPTYPLAPELWAEAVAALVDGLDVATVGGCCGTTPAHVEALARLLGGAAS